MKKFFSFVVCAGALLVANAQVIISPTGMMGEVGMQAEGMSPDASSYVAGSNQLSSQAAIWNVATDEIWEFGGADTIYQPIYGQKPGWDYIYDYESETPWIPVDSVPTMVDDYDNIVGYDSTLWDLNTYGGTFHTVNNSGLAVGAYGGAYSDKYPVKANFGDADVTYLYCDREVEAGGDAWAVNADGSVILGFYFDAAWITKACLWVNGGLTAEDRIDLPAPSEEEFGGPIDYVAARWMSEDARVILGYAQENYNGSWVMIYWTKNADNTYTVHGNYAKQYFTPYAYNEDGLAYYVKPNCPYTRFEPNAISANGEWVSLTLKPQYDMNDWNATELLQAARLNLTTGNLTVLNMGTVYDAPIFYGIANNGAAVGANEVGGFGPMSMLGEGIAANRVGYFWPANGADIYSLQSLFPNEEYFAYEAENGEAALSGISADGTKIVGYTNKTDGISDWVVTSFIATLPATMPDAVEYIDAAVKGVKMIENGQVVIIREGVKYNMMGQKLQ